MTPIKVAVDKNEYWDFCSRSFGNGYWKKMIPLMGTTATYMFEHPEDALAFRIMFGV